MTWLDSKIKRGNARYDSIREDIQKGRVTDGRRMKGRNYVMVDRHETSDMKPIYAVIKTARADGRSKK